MQLAPPIIFFRLVPLRGIGGYPPTAPIAPTAPTAPTAPIISKKKLKIKKMNTIFLSQRGNYKNLIVYQKSVMIYDITYYFAHHFLSKSDRTIDQMIQAARSGKQNIAEGNQAAATSLETEIKLTNVAKASLEELLIDYTDYLRVHNKTIWTDTHPRYEKTRNYAASKEIYTQYTTLLYKCTDEELANLCITLIYQTTTLLLHLLKKQESNFLKQGGIRERMYQARNKIKNTTP